MQIVAMKVSTVSICLFLFWNTSNSQSTSWSFNIGGFAGDWSPAHDVNSVGDIIVLGMYNSEIDLDPGPMVHSLSDPFNENIFVAAYDPNGNFKWAKRITSNAGLSPIDLVVDQFDNIYLTGHLNGTVWFDPNSSNVLMGTDLYYSAFVCKLDPNGAYAWSNVYENVVPISDRSAGTAVAVDASGNILFAGNFKGSIDFDLSGTSHIIEAQGQDGFVSKLDPNGNYIWAGGIGSPLEDDVTGLITDDDEGVLITGYFADVCDFDPGSGTNTLTTPGDYDGFLCRWDSSGAMDQVFGFSGSATEKMYCIDIAPNGDLIVGGMTSAGADVDPGPGTVLLDNNGGPDGFLCRLDPTGNFIWAKGFGGPVYDRVNDVAVTPAGDIYTIGEFAQSIDLDPGVWTSAFTSHGAWDMFVQKFDPYGDFIWGGTMGGTSIDTGNKIRSGSDGRAVYCGWFYGTADLDIGPGVNIQNSYGSHDISITTISNNDPIGIEETIPAHWSVYPNPAKYVLTINPETTLDGVMVFSDISGRELLRRNMNGSAISLELEPYGKGIYSLTFITEAGSSTRKVVLE